MFRIETRAFLRKTLSSKLEPLTPHPSPLPQGEREKNTHFAATGSSFSTRTAVTLYSGVLV